MNTSHVLRPVRLAAVLAACGALSLTACGKTISISDNGTKTSPAPATSAAAPTQTDQTGQGAAEQAGGNNTLEVVDKTAGEAGRTGTGGTVVGSAPQPSPPKWQQLSAVTSAPLTGPHLININQAALYRFDADEPNKSNCVDACVDAWPPVTVVEGGSVYLAGVNPKQVGAIRRPDGQIQLTIGTHPIYRYAGDAKPGELNGQGIGNAWFAVSPTGEKVTR